MKWKKDKGRKVSLANTGPENPLTNYLVLQNLLIYDSSPTAILRNRLVCRSWKDANDARWKQLEKFPVLRYSQPNVTDSESYNPMTTLPEFYTKLQEHDADLMELIPPRKLNLHEWERYAGEVGMSDLDSWFWSLISTNWLTNLTLSDCHFHEDIPICNPSFLSWMPGLKSLALKGCVVYAKAVDKINHDTLENNIASTRYRHSSLQNLEIALTLTPDAEANSSEFWVSLFGLLPSVKCFRWDGVIQTQNKPWHFHDLTDLRNFSDFASNLTSLDLLDFSGVARNYGFKLPHSRDFQNLEHIALDVGVLRRWLESSIYVMLNSNLKHVTLYRAPFTNHSLNLLLSESVDTLELWGNVVSTLRFRNVGYLGYIRKLIWNTTCYENKFNGHRIQRLLDEKRKPFPLFTMDLIKETGDEGILFSRLVYLDIDFGPLTLKSWDRLGQHGLELTTLKAVLGEDGHLELVVKYWPNLVCLELKHRSSVSASALLNQLPELERLTEFRWKSCACTQSKFTDAPVLRQVYEWCRRLKSVELPWKWTGYGDELVVEKTCKQAEFENALLLAASSKAFTNVGEGVDPERGQRKNEDEWLERRKAIERTKRHVNMRKILGWIFGLFIVFVIPSVFVYILMYLCL